MRAVGYRRPLPIEDPEALIDATLPDPAPTGRDLLVEVRAVSVWYAGSIARAGTDSELHLVDERIVCHMPASLDFARAAALPLTSITAWELLCDRLGSPPAPTPTGESLLIIGASGGVGSVLTQLACRLTGLVVIGTASSSTRCSSASRRSSTRGRSGRRSASTSGRSRRRTCARHTR
jgi:NADPH:quinone reductase-like Zn-dependent oxidoreductase